VCAQPPTRTMNLPSRTQLLTALAAILLPTSALQGQAIPLNGTTTYTQDFTSLQTTTQPWLDGVTLPGWFAGMNANNTPDGNLNVSDGSAAALSGLLNLGTVGASDRALGSRAFSLGGFACSFRTLPSSRSTSRTSPTLASFGGRIQPPRLRNSGSPSPRPRPLCLRTRSLARLRLRRTSERSPLRPF